MSKYSDPERCLKLSEVLEQEFAQLHGGLPDNYRVESDETARLKAIWAAIHREKQAALCISGGGIRSATFALGILQGLARCGLLNKFHYLSTVSGGGYIGSWLTAWIHRANGGLTSVINQLARPREDTRPNPEPIEIQNLRSYSNYLSPHLGLLSADSWTLAGTYLRNLILNWGVIIPLLAAVLTLPWIYTDVLMTNPPPYTFAPLWAGAICVVIGVAYMGINLPCGRNARWSQNRFLIFCLAPLLLASIFMTTHWAWFTYYGRPLYAWPLFGFGEPHTWVPFLYLGIGIHLCAWLGSLLPAHGFRFSEFLAVIISGAIGGALLWFGAHELFPQPIAKMELYTCFGVPLFMALFFSAIMVFAGISSRWTGDPDREWWGRATGWLLAVAAVWMIASSLVMFGPYILSVSVSAIWTLGMGGVAGLLTVLAGRSSAVPANENQADKAGPLAIIFSKAVSIAAVVFVAVLLIVITECTTWMMSYIGEARHFTWKLDTVSHVLGRSVKYLNVILYTPWPMILGLAILFALCGVAIAYLINSNKFSLHAMYRDRLIRAYLGASNKKREPNPFTGFDENDNVRMRELWRNGKSEKKLLPIINITLNLVGGKNLAWQERKAESFTVSPFHCGSYNVGYRKTQAEDGKRYGGDEGISLGGAITISGAAASPNMGYHSSPLVTFILTLLNVRLGAWLGNPGPAGNATFPLGYPRFSVGPMIAEAFGLTNDESPYVYLSDGGHFENLGLYEMVLRRCHYIVVSDAGEDPECSFADLGEAVRKIRIDLGIPIDFGPMGIYSRSEIDGLKGPGHNCAIGRIRYSMVDGNAAPDGIIVYIKPACYGDEPRDIYEYFKTSKTFPHESTKDQFFSESQFESYRMLGAYTMEKLSGEGDAGLPGFIAGILESHLETPAPDWLKKLLAARPDRDLRSYQSRKHFLKRFLSSICRQE
ncbi:MAG: patatin-like phospholipase family protein [Verrucomicrobiota bacterium]|nr:patatin-like phospholipase family protein [Verrucomicrobiota bacterium]